MRFASIPLILLASLCHNTACAAVALPPTTKPNAGALSPVGRPRPDNNKPATTDRLLSEVPGLIRDLVEGVVSTVNDNDERACAFTKSTIDTLLRATAGRGRNVVVFSDAARGNTSNLRGLSCWAASLPMSLSPARNYTICLFESGQFTRAGDGDTCASWNFGGCYSTATNNGCADKRHVVCVDRAAVVASLDAARVGFCPRAQV